MQYVKLDGDIGILGNGAGLVMSTLDVVAQAGGSPGELPRRRRRLRRREDQAGGRADPRQRRSEGRAVQHLWRHHPLRRGRQGSDRRVRGGQAVRPFVVRLDGTNDVAGRELLQEAALPNVHAARTMNEAAEKVVALAAGQASRERSLMSVLVDQNTRLAVAGITGREGSFHTLNNRRYGTNVVGGVTPGKGGQDVEGIPVFDSWTEAVEEVQAEHRDDLRAPRFAADSILEAAAAGVELVIAITEGIPAHDELRVYNTLKRGSPRHAADRPQLPGHPLARQGQRRHHPSVVLQGGQRRRGVALGHADLPDRQRDRSGRLRLQLDRRHRRRPGAGVVVCGRDRAVRGRRADRADRAFRRDRRVSRGGGRRVHRRVT